MSTEWEGPLFIVAMPRSGTKLLRTLLNQHARIRIPDAETEFLPYLARWVQENGCPSDEREFQRMFASLKHSTYFRYRRSSHPPFTWQQWRNACGAGFGVGELFESLVRAEMGVTAGDGIIWGDKSPAYVRHIGLLREHFPSARIVHIVRDVRDYCVSIRKAWGKDIRRAAYRWGFDVLEAHRQCAAAPGKCLEIRYEDLIAAPQENMRRVCDFLGIEFDAGLTRLQRPVENLGDATGRAEIVGDNARKFTSALSARELLAVESLAWEAMQTVGYVPEHATEQRHLGALSLELRRLADGVRLAIRDVGERGMARSVLFHWSHRRTVRR